MRPIFILWTRSFWLGVAPALLVLADTIVKVISEDPSVVPPIAALIGAVLGADPAWIESCMLRLAPILALIVAQQRSGQARPYSLDPRARD